MKTHHVWLLPPLDVGLPRQGLVLSWRRREQKVSPACWEAHVIYTDSRDTIRVEWVPSTYLRPVVSEPPAGYR